MNKALKRVLAASALILSLIAPAAADPPAAQGPPLLPSPIAILAMVRSTLVAVDQGNKTGNYTVLRDLAGPEFHASNDAAKLAQIFGPLTQQGVNLLPVVVVEPEYKTPPIITPTNMLYIVGSFPIAPRKVDFELLFAMHEGRWRVYGILIKPAPN